MLYCTELNTKRKYQMRVRFSFGMSLRMQFSLIQIKWLRYSHFATNDAITSYKSGVLMGPRLSNCTLFTSYTIAATPSSSASSSTTLNHCLRYTKHRRSAAFFRSFSRSYRLHLFTRLFSEKCKQVWKIFPLSIFTIMYHIISI